MLYPCVIIVFTSKAHVFRSWLWTTYVQLAFPILSHMHHLHTAAGWSCLALVWIHSIFHVIRWARLGHLHYLYEHQTGVTGLIGWTCITLVCIPMGNPVKHYIPYEIRKRLHMVCGVGFALAGALHAPATWVMYVYGSSLAIYVFDWLIAGFCKTYEVESCHFTRLSESVVLHFPNPKGFDPTLFFGYINVCVPFVSPHEWHAFSIYPHLGDNKESSAVVVAAVGDWSKKLHKLTEIPTNRPCWVQGPFVTPFAASRAFDNIIGVSTGVGISASLATVARLKDDRRCNLIWLCRDASMVEFYLENFTFATSGITLIFYTGKEELSLSCRLPPTVFLFTKRPDLRNVICTVIYAIESGSLLPDSMVKESEEAEARVCENARRNSGDASSSSDDLEASLQFGSTETEHKDYRPKTPKKRYFEHMCSQSYAIHMLKDAESLLATEVIGSFRARWCVAYCGGATVVSNALTKVCKEFGIAYEEEKFDW